MWTRRPKQSTTSGVRRRGGPAKANATIVTGQEINAIEAEGKGFSGLSREEWNRQLNFFNTQKEANQ